MRILDLFHGLGMTPLCFAAAAEKKFSPRHFGFCPTKYGLSAQIANSSQSSFFSEETELLTMPCRENWRETLRARRKAISSRAGEKHHWPGQSLGGGGSELVFPSISKGGKDWTVSFQSSHF